MDALTRRPRSLIVNGGARGIGAASARLLAEGGAHMLVADILDDEGRRLVEDIGERAV